MEGFFLKLILLLKLIFWDYTNSFLYKSILFKTVAIAINQRTAVYIHTHTYNTQIVLLIPTYLCQPCM